MSSMLTITEVFTKMKTLFKHDNANISLRIMNYSYFSRCGSIWADMVMIETVRFVENIKHIISIEKFMIWNSLTNNKNWKDR